MLKCLDILSTTFRLITYKLLTPVAVLNPDVEPDSSDGIDGVAKDHGAVHFEILAPFSFFGELLHGLGIAEVLRNQEIREQVGILGDCAHEIAKRKYMHSWGGKNNNVWDYMSVVSQYSYLFSYFLIPENFENTKTMKEFENETEWGKYFEMYSTMIFSDAIDSIARIWLHIWIKYKDWAK